jgi:hypothetical protein
VPTQDLVVIVLVAAGALAAAYVLLVIALRTLLPLRRAAVSAVSGFARPVSSAFDDLARDGRFKRLEEELKRSLGESDEWGDRERADMVAAAVAAQQINALNQSLRKSVRQCLSTHWAIVEGTGALTMSEAARHPLARQLRQRVMDVSELLSQRLARYPLLPEAPELVRLHVGLQWLPATCAVCPYFVASTNEAPRVCPTASAMFSRPNNRTGTPVDGEVIEACPE